MSMRHLFFTFAATWLLACAAPTEDEIDAGNSDGGRCEKVYYVTPEFTAEERQLIQRAADRWNAIAIQSICLRDKETSSHWDPQTLFRLQRGSDEWQKISDSFGGPILGAYWSFDVIAIVGDLDAKTFELVALHELGHAHGLRHITEKGIMYPSVGSADDFTAADMAECYRVGACL